MTTTLIAQLVGYMYTTTANVSQIYILLEFPLLLGRLTTESNCFKLFHLLTLDHDEPT